MSPETSRTVADTVILRYFLLVERTQLLADLLGTPIVVPRVVFDPEEGGIPSPAMSEVTRSIHFQRASRDPQTSTEERAQAGTKAYRLARIDDLLEAGDIEVTDLGGPERDWFARLTDRRHAADFKLRFGLQAGEAACVAIALERGLVLATDDQDALTAIQSVRRHHPYERIRKMLTRAVDEELLSKEQANQVHDDMRWMGFWDKSRPFPDLEG